MIRKSRFILMVIVAAGAFMACRRPRPTPPPVTPTTNQDSLEALDRARRDALARAEAARRDSLARVAAREDSLRAAREGAREGVRSTLASPIYFELDRDDLSAEARATLDAKLAILNANPALRLRIAGHCDERGSDEYNLALGQRRAASAKRYLTQRGIDEGRLEIVSFGEERPAASGSDETAWSQNRRDEFEITAGGDQLMAPSGP